MRWILLLLFLLGIGAAGLYFWEHEASDEESPIAYCPEDCWLILQCHDLNKSIESMQDSSSIYSAIPSFQKAISLIKTVEAEAKSENGHALISLSGQLENPTITIISNESISASSEAWTIVESKSKWRVLTSNEAYSPFVKDEHPEILSIDQSNENDYVFVSPSGIQLLIESAFTNGFQTRLIKELPTSNWIGFELSDSDLFQATAVAKVKGSEANDKNVSNLFRYLPSKTIAAMSFSLEKANYAIVYCDYGLEDSTELFLLIEETQDSTNSLDAFASEHFSKSWIKSANISMIGTLQLLSKDEEAAQRFINDYKAFNRLTEAAAFQSLGDKISESSFSLYIQKPAKYSNGFVLKEIEESNAVTSVIFQTNSEFSDTKSYSVIVSHHKEAKDESRKYWSLILDKPAEAGPWKFINHYTNEEEFIIQDQLHQLYLINREGKILWKKQLDNTIIGDLEMVDVFSSGKNQMLFNTKKRLIILDRNGNNIEGYPIKLAGETTVSPSALKYSKDAETRFFVNAGNYLYNYSVDGTETKGWEKPRTGKMSHPLKLLQIDNKDYLVAICSGDSIQFFDRKGQSRKKSIALKINVKQSILNIQTNFKNSSLTKLDASGNIVSTSLEGMQSSINILADSTMSIAVNEDSPTRYITLSGNQMSSYDEEGKEVFGYLFPSELKSETKWLDKSKDWLAISDGEKLFIVDTKNGPFDRMPIPGDIRCILLDTDNNGVTEVLSHHPDGTLTCYQLAL